jgi:hypothetical protein
VLPLFGLLWPLRFAQPHSRAAAVLVDELNTDRLFHQVSGPYEADWIRIKIET